MRMICCLPGFFLIMVLLGASPYEGGIPPDPNLKINAILRSGWKEKISPRLKQPRMRYSCGGFT